MAIYQVGEQSDEWYTPASVIDRVHEVLGDIDLDPTSNEYANRYVKAKTIFTKEDSCLDHNWHGNIFMNPPFSRGLIDKCTAKFKEEWNEGRITAGIVLVNSCTDTKWFQNLSGGTVAFTVGRLGFYQPGGDPLKPKKGQNRGQAIFYFGSDKQKFINVFTRDNLCWVPNV